MVILLAIKVPTGKQIPQRNNACGVEHELLGLRRQIEGLDVNEGLVSRCEGREISGDVELTHLALRHGMMCLRRSRLVVE